MISYSEFDYKQLVNNNQLSHLLTSLLMSHSQLLASSVEEKQSTLTGITNEGSLCAEESEEWRNYRAGYLKKFPVLVHYHCGVWCHTGYQCHLRTNIKQNRKINTLGTLLATPLLCPCKHIYLRDVIFQLVFLGRDPN